MRKYIIIFNLVYLVCSSFADAQTSVNLALRHKLSMKDSYADEMYILVQGDVKAIELFTKINNGHFINSAGDIASVKLSVAAIAKLIEKPFVKVIGSDIYHNQPMNDTMRMRTYVDEVHAGQLPLTQGYKGRGVLLGIIDSGIDYNHPDFRDSSGNTRVRFIWDMNLPIAPNTPAPYGYGQEFTKQQIDSGLAPADTIQHLFGHGTYVSGIAAGNGSAVGHFQGVAPEADLIVVGFDFSATDTVSRYAHAIEYIFNKAQLLGMPCAINASLGDYYGSHDGRDLQSLYIRNLINQQPGRVLVAAAGNIGINYPFHVGRSSIAGDTVFSWFKYNASYGGAYVQIFADTASFRNVRFSIGVDKVAPYYHYRGATPFSNVFPSINFVVNQSIVVSGKRLGRIQTYTSLNAGVYSIEVYVVPDSTPTDYNWRFTTTGNGRYDSWSFDWAWQGLPADTVFPDITHYHAPDTMQSIVSGMACLNNVITVGNYYNTDRHVDYDTVLQITPTDFPQRLAENSSRGPTRDGRIKPEIVAPGHHIISAGVLTQIPGLISAQPYKVAPGGFHITGGGTSASAPVVAGLAALYMEQNPGADWSSVKQAILNCASRDTFMWGPYPNNAWGYGKANAFASLTTCAATVAVNSITGENDFSIYPNPASGIINIELPDSRLSSVEVIDVNGRALIKSIFESQRFSLSMTGLSPGIYFVSIRQANYAPKMKKLILTN